MDRGTIRGTVKDAAGAPVADAAVNTLPSAASTITDAQGAFILSQLPVGAYTVTAEKAGFATTAHQGVGVIGGGTTLLDLTLGAPTGPGAITGFVQGASGALLAGAVVSAEGQAATATTDAGGAFSMSGVEPGFVYLTVKAPAGYLDGGNRASVFVPAGGTLSGVTVTLSGRPTNAATYTGEALCGACHPATATAQHLAAHANVISRGTARMVRKDMWPAVGQTLNPQVQALDAVDGTTMVSVYLCQNTAGVYSMKFGGAADCLAGDTTLVPVTATIGGLGDGGLENRPNFGVYKQRYLATPDDVPYARDHWAVAYTNPADRTKDLLILPVYLVQDGNTDPALGAVSPKFFKIYPDKWLKQIRTISRLCSGCHSTGLKIAYEGADALVNSYSYADYNITCERCHGPGSDHVSPPAGLDRRDTIISPRRLTARAAQEVCGQCHAAHSASSLVPAGQFKMPFNGDHLNGLGNGVFVPGLYELRDFIKGFNQPLATGGGVEYWPDGVHSKAHAQQYPTLVASKHANNAFERLACFDCHDAHSTYYGPASVGMAEGADTFDMRNPRWKDNTLCLSCHASHGSFAAVSKQDVAVLHSLQDAVLVNGLAATYDAARVAAARTSVARAVGSHMQVQASMGVAAYDPTSDAMPVGRCSSCHMPKIAKKNDTTDITQWHLGRDAQGRSAIADGNASSHSFDVVWPWQSAVLRRASGGSDLDIMPNSCSKCHPGARLSGD